jgi:molybdopterin-guanine dinucleotide biosynthesis protein A
MEWRNANDECGCVGVGLAPVLRNATCYGAANVSADHLPLSGVVLSGGKSRRLGQDKALLRLWGPQGPTLLEATVAQLVDICDEVLVVSDSPRAWPALAARQVVDRYPGGGSLGGIYTGLAEAAHPFALTVACDMPFLQPALLRYMAGLPRNYDVLIPQLQAPDANGQDARRRHVEPLHAIYGRPCLEPMRALLEQGERQIIRFFPAVRVRYLSPEEIATRDPAGLAFLNVNTPRDLEEVHRLLGNG